MKELKGTVALIPTPLTPGGVIDEVGLRKLIDYDLDNGCTGIGVNAAIGEGYLMSEADEVQAIRVAAEHIGDRAPLIAGAPALGTRQAVERCKRVEQAGADAILTFNPKFRGRKPYTTEELIDHYTAIADSVSIPIIPYSQEDDLIPFDVLKHLVDAGKVAHIKYAWGDCELLRTITQYFGKRLFVFVGADTYTLRYLLLGAHGISTATAAVFPKANSELLALVQAGEIGKARKLYNDRIVPWNDCGFYNFWHRCHKLALQLMGIIDHTNSLPPLHNALPDFQAEEITWMLKNQGLI